MRRSSEHHSQLIISCACIVVKQTDRKLLRLLSQVKGEILTLQGTKITFLSFYQSLVKKNKKIIFWGVLGELSKGWNWLNRCGCHETKVDG